MVFGRQLPKSVRLCQALAISYDLRSKGISRSFHLPEWQRSGLIAAPEALPDMLMVLFWRTKGINDQCLKKRLKSTAWAII